jgi:ribosomal-protein-alanine N-acetyltransferase
VASPVPQKRQIDDPQVETQRLLLRVGRDADAPLLLDYVTRNREHYRRWEPRVPASFFTLDVQRRVIARRLDQLARGESVCLLLFDRARRDGFVVGRCNFTEIVRGPFQACYLGYSIDVAYEGKGYMHEALRAAIDWVFTKLRLHRIMANYRPENERSRRLLERLGFVREGFAREYLFIDGRWADHVLTALHNPRPELVEVYA